MKKDKNRNIFCDVDESLVRNVENGEKPDLTFMFKGQYYEKKINYSLIKYLKERSSKGIYIVIWTSNSLGYEWAEQISIKLGIDQFVDDYLFKPIEIIDDCDLNLWYFNFKKIDSF
jgi:hypothetical protein